MYLLTYSRADWEKVPTRDVFAEMVSLAWMEMAGVKVIQWVEARELHADTGASESHSHYHMALKLEKRARWLKVRKFLDDGYGIKVNFSSNHNTYYSAYKYTTKEDRDCVHSEGHPDLENTPPPRTEYAIFGNKRKAARSARVSKKRKRGMSMYEVAQFVQAKNVKSRLQLMSIAASQNREGKTDLRLNLYVTGVEKQLMNAWLLNTNWQLQKRNLQAQRKLASNFCTTTIQGNA